MTTPVFHSQSEPWETAEGWEAHIAEVVSPVSQYTMAPREARAIVEAAGKLIAQGYKAERIIEAMETVDPYVIGLP